MGVEFYPVFDPAQPEIEFKSDGARLFLEFEILDEIAESRGLSAFSSFADNRPVPDGFDGEPEELEEILGPFDEWFPAEDGLRAFVGLRNAIATKADVATELEDADAIVADLDELIRCVKLAANAGAKFRLEAS